MRWLNNLTVATRVAQLAERWGYREVAGSSPVARFMETHDLVEIKYEIDFPTQLPKWVWQCTKCKRKCYWEPEYLSDEFRKDIDFHNWLKASAEKERSYMQNQECKGVSCPS